MISRCEADDLMSKWASEGTRLRIDLLTDETSFSIEGSLEAASTNIVRVRIHDAGFIEFFLDNSWGLEYFDPNVTGTPIIERFGRDHKGTLQETGSGLVGWAKPAHQLFMLEIVGGES